MNAKTKTSLWPWNIIDNLGGSTMARTKKSFFADFHNLRGLAIIFIVGAHATATMTWDDQRLSRLFTFIFNETSVIFMVITGFLYFSLQKDKKYPNFINDKAKNLVSPYLILSIPAVVIYTFTIRKNPIWEGFYDQSHLEVFLSFYATGSHLSALWYIPCVLIVFIFIIPIRWACERMGLFLFFFLLPISILLHRDFLVSWLMPYSDHAYLLVGLSRALHLLPAFLFGYLLYVYRSHLTSIFYRLRYLNLAMATGFTAILTITDLSFGWLIALKFIYVIAALPFIHTIKPQIAGRFVGLMGTISFPIFFLHGYVLGAVRIFTEKFDLELKGGVVLMLLLMAACLGFSYLAFVVAERLLGPRTRLFMGAPARKRPGLLRPVSA